MRSGVGHVKAFHSLLVAYGAWVLLLVVMSASFGFVLHVVEPVRPVRAVRHLERSWSLETAYLDFVILPYLPGILGSAPRLLMLCAVRTAT